MPFSWARPQNVLFPLNYLTFSAFDSDGETIVKYRVEDLKRNRFDEVIEIMKNKHLLDEPMYNSKGILSDPVSFQEMINNWANMLEQNISLICLKDGSDEIIAVNVLGVVTEAEFDAPQTVNFN